MRDIATWFSTGLMPAVISTLARLLFFRASAVGCRRSALEMYCGVRTLKFDTGKLQPAFQLRLQPYIEVASSRSVFDFADLLSP
jgi:hypothetical protein